MHTSTNQIEVIVPATMTHAHNQIPNKTDNIYKKKVAALRQAKAPHSMLCMLARSEGLTTAREPYQNAPNY